MIDFCKCFFLFLSLYIWYLIYCKSIINKKKEEKERAIELLSAIFKRKLAINKYEKLLEDSKVEVQRTNNFTILYKLVVIIIIEVIKLGFYYCNLIIVKGLYKFYNCCIEYDKYIHRLVIYLILNDVFISYYEFISYFI